jgi:hypothetical protein
MPSDDDSITNLKNWFDELPAPMQRRVVQFLYGEYAIAGVVQGQPYLGPPAGMVKEGGLFCGPAPASAEDVIRNARVCSACGRPL